MLVFLAGFWFGGIYQRSQEDLDLGQFWRVHGLIKERYVGELDSSRAVEGAIAGLVESLGDPFSSYLPSKARADLEDELRGEFTGIGAELTEKEGLITVVAPLAGSPAERSGLKPNDIIISIDEVSTEGMSLDEAVSRIRGEVGTSVTLGVSRSNASRPVPITIVRDLIQVKSVIARTIEGNITVLEIRQFGEDTEGLARGAVELAKRDNHKAVIIDLRNNPGGFLSVVPPVAGLFLPPSTVVVERYKNGKIEELKSESIPILPQTPVIVLVNGGTASAAEILAGALQDWGRAKVVGSQTFGKGSVQDLIPLNNNAALRLTIAEWLTPKRREINGVGLTPDVSVGSEKTDQSDPALDKALELIAKGL